MVLSLPIGHLLRRSCPRRRCCSRRNRELQARRAGHWFGDTRSTTIARTRRQAFYRNELSIFSTYNWFASPFIVKPSVLAGLALVGFVLWQFLASQPLVNFRLLGRRNFGFGTLGNFLLGFALYGSAYLLPQYLAVAQRLDAEQIGQVVAWTGLPQLLVIPLVPLLMKRIDARVLAAIGLAVFAASCFMNLRLDQDYAALQLLWRDVIRALGQAIVMTPISAIALVGIEHKEAGAASGLFNMMRNLGGAIGTAAIETFFTLREQFHSAMITPSVSLLDPATRDRLVELQRYFAAHGVIVGAVAAAIGSLWTSVGESTISLAGWIARPLASPPCSVRRRTGAGRLLR